MRARFTVCRSGNYSMSLDYTSSVELRAYQKDAVKRVLSLLREGKNVVLSMPTGSGKTLVSLIAALSYARGQGVSVFTRTLAEYQAWEREARRLGVYFSGHVGRDRVCKYGPNAPTNLRDIGEQDDKGDGAPKQPFRPLLRCVECTHNLVRTAAKRRGLDGEYEDWDVLLKGKLGRELEAMQVSGVEAWVSGWKKKEHGCGYPFARDVPTTIKLFTHLSYFLLWKYVGVPSAVYIFDEAHNLAGITRNLTFTLSYNRVNELLRQYEDLREFGSRLDRVGRLAKQADGVSGAIEFLSGLLAAASWESSELPKPPSEVFEGDERIQRLIAHVKLVEEDQDIWRFRKILLCPNPQCRAENQEGVKICSACGSKIDGDEPSNRALKLVPVDPAFLLRRMNSDRWLLLSGSMPNPWYLRSVLGLTNFEVVELNPFEKLVSYYLDDELDMSYANRRNVKDLAVERAVSLKAKRGVTLLVTQNYDEVGWFTRYADVVESPKTTIGEVLSTVEQRCSQGKPTFIVGVARGKLFEGVEFKYEGKSAVRRVILLGVPYPNTKDEDFKEMAEYLKEKRGVNTWDLLMEDAVIAAKQAVGRAVRGPEDSAEVFFLDKRFRRLFKRMGVTRYTVLTGNHYMSGVESTPKTYWH